MIIMFIKKKKEDIALIVVQRFLIRPHGQKSITKGVLSIDFMVFLVILSSLSKCMKDPH